jgi:glycosyltransferase involved in cell wall biosynthesis
LYPPGADKQYSVTALICTLNEAENLPHVLPEIPEWVDEILIVDGHSTDDTVKVIMDLCPRAKIVIQPGKGKAEAIKLGVQQATGDIIAMLDADGETPPAEMENFIKPLLEGYDLTKGTRLFKKLPPRMPIYRWFGNKVLAITCNVLYGTRFTDVCSGYNVFWKKHFLGLTLSYGIDEVGCSMEQQMIVKMAKAGMKIKEVPHTSKGRISGSSVISGFRLALKQGFTDWFIIMSERFRG